MDLFASKPCKIPAGGIAIVATDLAVACPEGTYGRIAPRSGLTTEHHLNVGAGVVDADFRGAVEFILFNHGTKDYEVTSGQKIAQLILERYLKTDGKIVSELGNTSRGEAGFGSTGS